jgi:hypothetical protein
MNVHHFRAPRSSIAALALSLLGIFFLVPSAQAHGDHIQRFLAISTDTSENATTTVLGFGPIHAKGIDKTLSDTRDVFIFPRGRIFVTHTPQHSRESADPVTCLYKFWESGTYKVTRGTGAYEDVLGYGHYRVKGLVVGCEQDAEPETAVFQIKAAGPLRY